MVLQIVIQVVQIMWKRQQVEHQYIRRASMSMAVLLYTDTTSINQLFLQF